MSPSHIPHQDAAGRIWNAKGGRRAENWRRSGERWTVQKRADWHDVNQGIMMDLLRKKFEIPELRMALLGTGDRDLKHKGTVVGGILYVVVRIPAGTL